MCLVWDKLSWGVPYDNRLGRTRAVKGRNKDRYGIRLWNDLGFMVSLYILRYDSGIIVSLGEIRPFGRLTIWEKLACKDGSDWPNKLEGPDQTE